MLGGRNFMVGGRTFYAGWTQVYVDYAHNVIGFHQYSASDKRHTKAIRAYPGVGHSAPRLALRSEIAWLEPRSRTQVKILSLYYFLKDMDNNRPARKRLLYDQSLSNCNPSLSTWSNKIKPIISRNNLLFSIGRIRPKYVCKCYMSHCLKQILLCSDRNV